MQTTPFTYLIGWSDKNLWYYGSKSSRGCNPSDLWTKYFSSSKLVKFVRSEFGEPNIIQIRKIFKSVDTENEFEHQIIQKNCIEYESKVLRRIKAVKRIDFLNMHDNNDGKFFQIQTELVRKYKSKVAKNLWLDKKFRENSLNKRKEWVSKNKKVFRDIELKKLENEEYKKWRVSILKPYFFSAEKNKIMLTELWKNNKFREKMKKSRTGLKWWNNGKEEIRSKNMPECDGPWIRGRFNKGNLGRKGKISIETNKN